MPLDGAFRAGVSRRDADPYSDRIPVHLSLGANACPRLGEPALPLLAFPGGEGILDAHRRRRILDSEPYCVRRPLMESVAIAKL